MRSRYFSVHVPQKMLPQRRQWWRRMVSEKGRLQVGQSNTALSACQTRFGSSALIIGIKFRKRRCVERHVLLILCVSLPVSKEN